MRPFMPILLSLLIGFTQAVGATPARAEDTNEEFIQGTWRLTGQNDPQHSWYLEWTFDHGKFTLDGYPPLHQTGNYRILKTEGAKMALELYDQKGELGTENSQIEVVLNRAKGTLTIKGQGPFTRTKPQT